MLSLHIMVRTGISARIRQFSNNHSADPRKLLVLVLAWGYRHRNQGFPSFLRLLE